ncbi:MAG TPA: tyrosine-type recombinase/integrase [Nocardioides sp.]|uniref:tyrosine-type recombinase/integrase n=1 Tax=Nocardioides sp. TaxID=35761 RepID=UPI002EDA6EE1
MHDATLATPLPTKQAHLYAAMFLARYAGPTRELYGIRMRLYLQWCEQHDLDPITGITRSHLELFARHLEDDRHNGPGSVAGWLTTLKMFYRLLAVDQVIPVSPAEYVRMPKVYVDDTRIAGLTRNELAAFVLAARGLTPDHSALATLLGLCGLRVSEACGVQVGDFSDYERGHRVLRLVGKGGKPATIPIPPAVFRELDRAAEGRTGHLLRMTDGITPMHRKAAARRVQVIANAAGITRHVWPHLLRHSYVTAALDAGVPLRDVQIAARHSDPRTTTRYDRARGQLDRHANHTVAAFIAGGA